MEHSGWNSVKGNVHESADSSVRPRQSVLHVIGTKQENNEEMIIKLLKMARRKAS